MEALAEKLPERWFTPDYRDDHTEEMKSIRQMVMSTDPEGYAGCCAVLRDTDLSSAIGEVLAPCLVITGTYDPATPPSRWPAAARGLRQSSYVELRASHLSAWERPDEFAGAVLAFLETAEVSHG